MPSRPRRAASRASSTCWMPLTRIGSEVCSRSQARSSQFSAGLAWTPRKWPVAAPDVLLRRLLQAGAEDRVLEVVGEAHAVEEGQPGLLQVARLPAGDEGVDGDDDGAVAGPLGAADEALDQLAVVRPVELEPARRVGAAGGGDLLQAEVRGGAGDHRRAHRGRGAGAWPARPRRGRPSGPRSAPASAAPASPCRARWSRGRGWRRRAASAARSGGGGRRRRWRGSCPRCRLRRRRSWPPAAPSPRPPGAPARRSRPGRRRLAAEPAHVDLAVVVGGVGHRGQGYWSLATARKSQKDLDIACFSHIKLDQTSNS